jgi:bacillithiol biosynthesis cysteine-adding enzyme BshC
MKKNKIPLSDTSQFSSFFLDYISQEKKLEKFYEFYPGEEGFKYKLGLYDFPEKNRVILTEVLNEQYSSCNPGPEVQHNLSLLKEKNTYTITTGHQLNIFTGPLYFIYKIVTAIKLCQHLKEHFPGKDFVPVYWMATEDHDFGEINNFTLFNKKYTWETTQRGAVGRFDPSGIAGILSEIQEKLPIFERAYLESKTLADATRFFVNELFGKYGLVVLDGDNKKQKELIKHIIKEELTNNVTHRLVSQSTSELERMGYKPQVNSREINLFYLAEGIRERIVKEEGIFKINNTEISFSLDEILTLADTAPERFSPNVLLRPLYQEIVLPNLAYVGGPSEILYWLQLKGLFEHFKVAFPLLIPRNFVLYVTKAAEKKMRKFGLEEEAYFLNEDQLKDKYLQKISDENLSLSAQHHYIDALYDEVSKKASMIDTTLVPYVLSEKQKMVKNINEIEKKLKKTGQKKNAETLNQLVALKNRLFPDNSLQERKENFLSFYINDTNFIDKLVNILEPFDFSFNILIEE